jgi:hypothetical protein
MIASGLSDTADFKFAPPGAAEQRERLLADSRSRQSVKKSLQDIACLAEVESLDQSVNTQPATANSAYAISSQSLQIS